MPWLLGVAGGAPALVLGVMTFLRDRGARATAAARPDLAWGDHGSLEIAGHLANLAASGLGIGLLILLAGVTLMAIRRRDAGVLAPLGACLFTFVGIVVLAPVARVQPYYLVAVLPLAVLAIGIGAGALPAAAHRLAPAVVALVVALSSVPQLASARGLYVPPADAFMPPFAQIVSSRPERRIVTVAHYDGTLLAYYLARNAAVPMDWNHLQPEDSMGAFLVIGTGKVLDSLAHSHALAEDPDGAALTRLEGLLAREPVLVVERDGFHLPRLSDRLRRCERLAERGTGRLYRCAGQQTAP